MTLSSGESSGKSRQSLVPWCLMLVIMACVCLWRVRWFGVSLERDEGEYAYMGQQMLHGIPPFREAYNMKLPGTHASYALIEAIFGQSLFGLRLGFLLVNLFTIGAVFWLGRKLFDARVGVWAAAFFAAFSQSPAMQAPFGHATHFVNLWVVVGMIELVRARENGKTRDWFLTGTCFGLAIIMKQQGLFLALFALGLAVFFSQRSPEAEKKWSTPLALSGGIIWPLAALCLMIWFNGDWARFWYWTFDYGVVYASSSSLQEGWALFCFTIKEFGPDSLLWAIALVGVGVAIRTKRERALLVGWFFAAALSVFSGLYFRGHYFIPLLPPAALLGAFALVSFEEGLKRRFSFPEQMGVWAVRATGVLAIALVVLPRWSLIVDSPHEISRRIYGQNPFPDSIQVGEYIEEHTKPDDQIAVVGSEPEIYFYSKRRAATGYLYTFPLMEVQPLAQAMNWEMAAQIQSARPELIVWEYVSAAWLPRPKSNMFMFQWWRGYQKNYYIDSYVEIWPNGPRFVAPSTANYKPRSPNLMIIWRKKPT